MTASLLLLVGLSGCIGGGDGAKNEGGGGAATVTASVDDDTGGIQGAVFGEDDLPVAGAQVGIRDLPDLPIYETAEAGGYEFSKIPPGQYIVEVSKIGFKQAREKVTVAAGQVATQNFKLVEVPHAVPFEDFQDQAGRVWASAGWTVMDCTPHETQPLLTAIDCNSLSCEPGCLEDPNYENIHAWNVTDPEDNHVETIIVEAKWPQQNLACRSTFQFDVIAAGRYTTGNIGGGVQDNDPHQFSADTATSPIYVRIDRGHLAERGLVDDADPDASIASTDDKPWFTRAFAEGGGTTNEGTADVGCSYEQPFTVYFTVFYGDPAPEGFSRAADA